MPLAELESKWIAHISSSGNWKINNASSFVGFDTMCQWYTGTNIL